VNSRRTKALAALGSLLTAASCISVGDPLEQTASANGSGGEQPAVAARDGAVAGGNESAETATRDSPANPRARQEGQTSVAFTPRMEEAQNLDQVCSEQRGSVCNLRLEVSAPAGSIYVLDLQDRYSLNEIILASGSAPASQMLWRLGAGAVSPNIEVHHRRRGQNIVFEIVYSYLVDWTVQYPRVHTWDIEVGCAPAESGGWACGPGAIQRYRSCLQASPGDYCSQPEIEIVFDYGTSSCHVSGPAAGVLPTSTWYGGSVILSLDEACARVVRSPESG